MKDQIKNINVSFESKKNTYCDKLDTILYTYTQVEPFYLNEYKFNTNY